MNPLTKSRILIADHDQNFLDQLADRLLQMDMEVDFAENGKIAMKLVESESYDLIITEIAIPFYNGLEILRKVKANSPHTSILILSYDATLDWAEQAMREGAYEFLRRPLGDITKFDIAVRKGLEIATTTQVDSNTQNSFSREFFESLPQTEAKSPFDDIHKKTDSHSALEFNIPNPPFETEVPSTQAKPTIEHAPWEQTQPEIKSLPEGMIELNENGQIMSCSAPARNWLMLEANSSEKPIKELIKALGKRTVPDHIRVQINGRQVHLVTKTILDRTGTKRFILVIREAKAEAKAVQQSAVSRPVFTPPVAKPVPEKGVAFSSSLKKYQAESQDHGWSPLGFLDQMKTSILDEVEKIKDQNPFELFGSKPEEVDPEMVFTMSRRISDVSRGKRTSF
jgi:DNA-binding NarL/FixJ family response regulator